MDDALELVVAALLIAANAFFVAAEFSLISARRDRLEALAEQGRARAVTVIRAGEQLPSMLAGDRRSDGRSPDRPARVDRTG